MTEKIASGRLGAAARRAGSTFDGALFESATSGVADRIIAIATIPASQRVMCFETTGITLRDLPRSTRGFVPAGLGRGTPRSGDTCSPTPPSARIPSALITGPHQFESAP